MLFVLLLAALPAATLGQDRPSPEAMTVFSLVQELRHTGFTCPDGTSYPPNLKPFEWDCRLFRAARGWSQAMAAGNFIATTKAAAHLARARRQRATRTCEVAARTWRVATTTL